MNFIFVVYTSYTGSSWVGSHCCCRSLSPSLFQFLSAQLFSARQTAATEGSLSISRSLALISLLRDLFPQLLTCLLPKFGCGVGLDKEIESSGLQKEFGEVSFATKCQKCFLDFKLKLSSSIKFDLRKDKFALKGSRCGHFRSWRPWWRRRPPPTPSFGTRTATRRSGCGKSVLFRLFR